MAYFRVSIQEQEALYGIPFAAQVLYYALLARADFRTRRVGAIYAISWQALREALYIEPHSGIKHQQLHSETVRRLAGWLKRRRLIRFQSNLGSGRLIFLLPKAMTNSLVQNKPDRKPTGYPDRKADRLADGSNDVDLSMETRRCRRSKNAQADREADRVKQAQPDTHQLTEVNTTTTTASINDVVVVVIENLEWPKSLTPTEKATLKALLQSAKLNGLEQVLLDELAGAMKKSAVRNKPGYLRTLIARAKAGDFVAEKAFIIADERDMARKSEARMAQARQGNRTNPPASAATSLLAMEIREQMRKKRPQ